MKIVVGNVYCRILPEDGDLTPMDGEFLPQHVLPKGLYDDFVLSIPGIEFSRKTIPWAAQFTEFISRQTGRFGVGLLSHVCKWLDESRLFYTIEDLRSDLIPSSALHKDLLPGITFRDYQMEALQRCMEFQNGLVSSPTASGKTPELAAIPLIYEHSPTGQPYRHLFLLDRVSLARQTIRAFREYGVPVNDMCLVSGKSYERNTSNPLKYDEQRIKKARIVMCMTQMAAEAIKGQWGSFDAIELDESHHARGAGLREHLRQAKRARIRLGFSGTPLEGKWGYLHDDFQRQRYIGPVIYNIKTNKLVEAGYLSKPIIRFIEVGRNDLAMHTASGYREVYDVGIVHYDLRNDIFNMLARGLLGRTIILYKSLEHGAEVMKRFGYFPDEWKTQKTKDQERQIPIFHPKRRWTKGKGKSPAKQIFQMDGNTEYNSRDKMLSAFVKSTHAVLVASSLPAYEGVVVQDENGIIHIKQIYELFQMGMKGLLIGWKALSINGYGRTQWKSITGVYEKKALDTPIVRVSTKCNMADVHVTDNHSLIYPDKGKIIKVKPNPKKTIAIIKNIPENAKTITQLNIGAFFSRKCYPGTYFWLQDGPSRAEIKRWKSIFQTLKYVFENNSWPTFADYRTLKHAKNWTKNYIDSREFPSLTTKGKKLYTELSWFFQNCFYKKYRWRCSISNWSDIPHRFRDKMVVALKKSTNYLPTTIDLTPTLVRWLGLFIAEGSTTIRNDLAVAAITSLEGNEEFRIVRGKIFNNKNLRDTAKNGFKEITRGMAHIRINKTAIWCHSRLLCWLLIDYLDVGKGSINKKVPWPIFHATNKNKWEFLTGFYVGDGTSASKKLFGLISSSRILIQGIVLLLRQLSINEIYGHSKIDKMNYRSYYLTFKFPTLGNEPFGRSRKKAGRQKNRYWKNIYNDTFSEKIESVKNTTRLSDFVYDISVKDNENFVSGTLLFACHNTIFDEGMNIPQGINNLIVAGGEKSYIKQIQRLGRGLRPNDAGMIHVFDCTDRSHTTLLEHSYLRASIWSEEGHEIIPIKINDL